MPMGAVGVDCGVAVCDRRRRWRVNGFRDAGDSAGVFHLADHGQGGVDEYRGVSASVESFLGVGRPGYHS